MSPGQDDPRRVGLPTQGGVCREGQLGCGNSTCRALGQLWEMVEAGAWRDWQWMEALGGVGTGAVCVTLEFMGVMLAGPLEAWSTKSG